MNLRPSILLKGGEMILKDKLKGDIEFKSVSFAYPTRREQVTSIAFIMKYSL